MLAKSVRPIKLLLVDDHSMVRMGFATLLGAEQDFHVAAEAEDAEQAVRAYREHTPDVTLLDIRMPGGSGIEALTQIRAEFPAARIVMLTTYDLEEPLFDAYDAGAAGYLLKSVKRAELVAAIRLVAGGGRCFGEVFENRMSTRVRRKRLSLREAETLDLLRRGLSNKDIGIALGVSENTAKAHVKSILQKLEVADRAEAVAVGFQLGLLQLE
ncbi:MAG: response regulator transcription factor [Verrucomicrobiota bacterium]